MLKHRQIAIVGSSLRFPGSAPGSFWQDLLAGCNLITTVDAARWSQAPFLHPDRRHPASTYTFASGSLGDISGFDAQFFGISPREAAMMDPQQRMLLELCWETFESAGVKPSSLRGSNCGVFLGIAGVEQSYRMVEDMASIDAATATGNTMSIAANRLSWFYDLRGPSMAIDTACSSSLVAFHQACQAIRSGEIDQAITGGISLHMHPFGFMIFAKASMLSRTGRCHAFDRDRDGYVRSEGGGLFMLKDHDQALRDGNPILAIVAGSAVNTDGRKSSLTLPSADAQAALLSSVYARAGIEPAQIDYLEAHGTGTAVGDPIEARAIGEALGQARGAGNALPIGSIKSNIGHLEAASGVAGLAKALGCIRERQVPATIGIGELNPDIAFGDLNLDVVTRNLPLRSEGQLTIGINSFGFGGANAHVILQGPPGPAHINAQERPCAAPPLMLSARSVEGLRASAGEFARFLDAQPQVSLYDAACQATLRRDLHAHRLLVIDEDRHEVTRALAGFAQDLAHERPSLLESGQALDDPRGPVFVYSGNGSQWLGMGRVLLDNAVFLDAVAEIDVLFAPLAGFSLRAELAGEHGDDRYARTEIAQPALFAVQVGVTRLLAAQGHRPVAVIGHSVGEVAAAWACGALSLEDAVQVIHHRSRLQGLTRGAGQMSAVGLGGEATAALLAELGLQTQLVVAGENSHKGTTVAGSVEALAVLEEVLAQRQTFVRRLGLDYAFHSPAMDPIRQQVIADLAHIRPRPCKVPFHSTVLGRALPGEQLDSHYWWRNIRCPVLFHGAMDALVTQGHNLFVEVGPHPVLRGYVGDALNVHDVRGQVVPTLMRNDHDAQQVERAVARLMIAGAPTDWQMHFPVAGAFVALPHYPWQHEHFSLPVSPQSPGLLQSQRVHPLLGYPLADHALTWENQLDTRLFPTLGDHRVGDAVLFPGAGFAELVIAVASIEQPGDFIEIEELEIHDPLILSGEGSKKIRVRLEPDDGTVSIASRNLARHDDWLTHVVARLPGEARGVLLGDRAPAVPQRVADLCREQHLALTRAAGLDYGPAYQCVDAIWLDGDSVIARLNVPHAIEDELAGLHLHPALLDGAFQLIGALLAAQQVEHLALAFVPVRLGRIAFATSGALPCLAQVRQLKRTAHSLLVDISLYDARGNVVLCIKGARFRGVRLCRDPGADVRLLGTTGIPMPCATATAQRPATFVSSALARHFAALASDAAQVRYLEEVEPLLDSLCASFVLDLVEQAGGELSQQQYLQWSGNPALPTSYLDLLLRQGLDDGLLVRSASGAWQAAAADERPASRAIWQELSQSYPQYFQIIHSVGRIGTHLLALLEGRVNPDALMPRETSPSALARQVLGSAGRQCLAEGLRQQLREHLASLPEGQRLRVLELDFGDWPLAPDLYCSLDFDRLDYSLCIRAEDEREWLRADCPHLQLLDFASLEADVKGYDCVLVPTDLAALANIGQGLSLAIARCNPNARVVLLAQHPSRWTDFVFGGQSDWWLAGARQTLSRQQSPAFWTQELQRQGLVVEPLLEALPGMACGSYLLQASVPGQAMSAGVPVAPQRWALLAEPGQVAAQTLEQALREQGQHVQWLLPGDARSLAEQLASLCPSPQHIVHLAGLDSPLGLQNQTQRCQLAADLVQACDTAALEADCWLVTRGAAGYLLPTPDVPVAAQPHKAHPSLAGLGDAALWGFGRTLANESPGHCIRLLDLAEQAAIELAVPALLNADAEVEMAIGATGCRHVPRLRMLEPAAPQLSADPARTCIGLGFEMPGQLRNLQWQARPLRVPGDDDLEIQVKATGLNFRDVMFALGLLSDEAIENGFSGPTLGFEFAGVVQDTGNALPGGFVAGDRVMGFGPSSFADRLVTQANAVARIPEGMSFEAAATIPSAFFTVFYALHHLARLMPGEKVLIHGAAGGVGLAAIQVARWCDAEIYATAGSDEKRDLLHLLGVEHVFDSRSLAFADDVLTATGGRGVDVVLNSLAGEAINRNLRVLRPFGRFLELGKRDFYQNTRLGLRPFRNNISYFGIDADQLMSERPDLTRTLFTHMMQLFEQGILHPLPFCEFDANQVADAMRHMQQARQIGKIVVTYRNPLQRVVDKRDRPAARLALDARATYLVTGGLTGLGLRTAQWLVGKGARHLVLLGRRGGATEEAQPLLAQWQAQGIDVQALACDITDRMQLAQVIDMIATGPYPLRGVVHAAAVIEDGLAANLDVDRLRRVLEPKARGAQHLHELTLDLPLDFFVLFSSATTLFGNPGQASYVAANHWLEALAHHRRSLGLVATSVLWGAIGDAGFLARNTRIMEALHKRMGGTALPADLALARLEQLLLSGESGLGVLELDWRALARFLPTANTPRFSALARLHDDEHDELDDAEDIRQMLESLDDKALVERFEDMLKHEVSQILRLPAARLDRQRPLQELGLDSLMSVELVTAMEQRFGVRLPVMELSESSSIGQLAVRLLALLRGEACAGEVQQQAELTQRFLARHGAEADPLADSQEAAHDIR